MCDIEFNTNKAFFKKSIGGSKLGQGKWGWNNLYRGVPGPFRCELCGTVHPEFKDDEGDYIISRFLGLDVVEECCGRVFDIFYQEIGEEFASVWIQEFAKSPLDPRFGPFRILLEDALKKIRSKNVDLASSPICIDGK